MTPAALPSNEAERLAALRQYDVLDTPAEAQFDDLTALAAHICEAPIALISLIDEDRQWFKSRFGIDAAETKRSIAFCSHAILHPEMFIVEDASKDPRFSDNPLVTNEPNIRFYAGAPLVSPDGHALGTLCVIDRKARELAPEHQQAMRVLSRHVMTQLELRRRNKEAESLRSERLRLISQLEHEKRELERRVAKRTSSLEASRHDKDQKLALADRSRRVLLSVLEDQRKAEADAKRRNAVLESVFQAIPDLFFLMDSDGTIRDYRARRSSALYINPEAFLGKRMQDILPPELSARFAAAIARVIETNTIQRLEYDLVVHDGERHFEARLSGLTESRQVVSIVRDITESYALQRSLSEHAANLQSIFDQAAVGVALVDTQGGQVVRVNQRYAEIVGYSIEELTSGKTFQQITHPDDLFNDRIHLQKLRDNSIRDFTLEKRYIHKSGHIVWVSAAVSPTWKSGEDARHHITVVNDITDRKREESAQRLRSSVLDHIVDKQALRLILDEIASQLETIQPDTMVSILLANSNGTLSIGAAPSLPDFFNVATEGLPIGEGIGSCGSAASSGKPVIVTDVQSHPNWKAARELAQRVGFRACWSYPFKDDENLVLGTLAVYSPNVRAPSDAEEALIKEFASLTGLAVQRVREESARQAAEDELRQREQALEMAVDSALDLLRASDPDIAVNRVLERIGLKTGVDRVQVFAIHPEAEAGRTLSSQRYKWVRDGLPPEKDKRVLQNVAFEDGFERWHTRLATGQIIKGRSWDFPATERVLLDRLGILSLLIVPIMLNDRLWGVLAFDSVHEARDWTHAEESVLRIVAASLGSAISRQQGLADLRQAAAVFDNTQEGVTITDLDGHILAVNPAFSEITGYAEAECLGKSPSLLNSGRQNRVFYQSMWASLKETGAWQGEIWNRRKDGGVYPQILTISAIRDGQGQPTGYVGVLTDISQIKQSQARLEHLAHYDPLTDLPNRLLVAARVKHAIAAADRGHERGAVLFLDLDQFKTVNDSLGHAIGDELLSAVAKRLRDRLRNEDTFGRLGGDEFILLLERIRDPQDAAVVARDLIDALNTPFMLANTHEVYIRASIGISIYPDDGNTADDLIRNADAAMYRAKSDGRNTYGFYTQDLTRAASERLQLETRLRQALERNEFVLYYQPLISLADERAIGAEALIRWQPPGEQQVPPGQFIPLAEETGLIVPLGEWVLREASRQAKAWLDAGLPLETIAVNVSVRQFQRSNFSQQLDTVLRETGLPAACLELEITETGIMAQGEHAVATLNALRARGVRLAIDDFGTGYSSLAYLKQLPLDKLKIDRSFVGDLPNDANDTAIAATIIAMARTLGLKVLAEGVETEAQRAFLKAEGCDFCQGFLFSPPIPAAAFTEQFWRPSS